MISFSNKVGMAIVVGSPIQSALLLAVLSRNPDRHYHTNEHNTRTEMACQKLELR